MTPHQRLHPYIFTLYIHPLTPAPSHIYTPLLSCTPSPIYPLPHLPTHTYPFTHQALLASAREQLSDAVKERDSQMNALAKVTPLLLMCI